MPATTGGIYGSVTRGPLRPVCSAELACDGPAKDAVLVFSKDGGLAARVTTDVHGHYRLKLAAGLYTVRLGARSASLGRLEPRKVLVGRTFARRNFSIDTGIR